MTDAPSEVCCSICPQSATSTDYTAIGIYWLQVRWWAARLRDRDDGSRSADTEAAAAVEMDAAIAGRGCHPASAIDQLAGLYRTGAPLTRAERPEASAAVPYSRHKGRPGSAPRTCFRPACITRAAAGQRGPSTLSAQRRRRRRTRAGRIDTRRVGFV